MLLYRIGSVNRFSFCIILIGYQNIAKKSYRYISSRVQNHLHPTLFYCGVGEMMLIEKEKLTMVNTLIIYFFDTDIWSKWEPK